MSGEKKLMTEEQFLATMEAAQKKASEEFYPMIHPKLQVEAMKIAGMCEEVWKARVHVMVCAIPIDTECDCPVAVIAVDTHGGSPHLAEHVRIAMEMKIQQAMQAPAGTQIN